MAQLFTAGSQYAGIIPYGSTDDSILLQCSLGSSADIASPAIGSAGTEVVIDGTGVSFSADGLICDDKAGNTGTVKFTGLSSELDNAGQMSFEVESKFLACIDGANYTGRTVSEGQDVNLFSTGVNDNTILTLYQRHYFADAVDKIRFAKEGANGTTQVRLSSINMPDMVRLTQSWIGNENHYFIENITGEPEFIFKTNRYVIAGLWSNLWIGSNKGNGGAYGRMNAPMRNLQISTRPVMFPIVPNSVVSMVGDSFVEFGHAEDRISDYSVGEYQGRIEYSLEAYFRKRGRMVDIRQQGVANDYIADVAARRATILADNPDYIMMNIGINDVIAGGWDDATFDTAIRGELNAYIAAGVSKVCVNTVISLEADTTIDTPTNQANLAEGNIVINALTDITGVEIFDAYTAFGSPLNPYVCKGQVKSTDDVHPSTLGNYLIGNGWGEKLGSWLGLN